MFTNNNCDRNLWIGAPFPPEAPPAPSKKSNSTFIVRFWWNLKHNIFICLPTIIEIEIYEWESPDLPGGPSSFPKKMVKFLIYGAILLIKSRICLLIIIEFKIYEKGPPFPSGVPPHPLKKVQFFIYSTILLRF